MLRFIFFTAVLLSFIVSMLFFFNIKGKFCGSGQNKLLLFFTVFMTIIAITDISGIIDFGSYQSAFAFIGIVTIVEFIISVLHRKYPLGVLEFSSKVLIITSVLELTLFNFPVYHLWFGNYKEMELDISEASIECGIRNDDGSIVVGNQAEMIVTFDDINMPVGTVKSELEFGSENIKEAQYVIDIKDDTQSKNYRYNIANSRIVEKREKSQTIICDFSGNISDMRVKFTPKNSNDEIFLKKIYVNTDVPIDISVIRFLFITLVPIFIYAVMREKFMQKEFSGNRKFCKISSAIITAVCCAIVFSVITYKLSDKGWKGEFKQTTGNQMTQELVDAFENGQVNLLAEPSDDLNALENPYDRDERDSSGANALWDHVYYNNNYYSYYGIAPVILFFLPYHKLTGYYCPDSLALLVFSVIGIAGLTSLFWSFIKKWFSDISTGIYITCLILIQTASGVWFSIGRAWFYETAMAAGFAFLSWAVFFLFESNIIGKEKISLWKTAAASLFSAIAVLCRPTLVLYCICTAVFMLMAFSKSGKTLKNRVTYLMCAFLPMVCLGCVQMWYNYARFDSPFDFGIQYSLTINDFTNSQYHTNFVLMAWFNYLFNAPVFSASYPFIGTEFQTLDTNGFFYADYLATSNTSGLFFLALPMFAYILSGQAVKRLPDRRTKVNSMIYFGIPCVLIPVVIIASVWESGYAVRYMLDFSWEMIIGALAIIFFLLRKTQNQTIKKLIKAFLCFSMVWALIVSGVQSVNQAFRYAEYHYEYPEIAYSIEQIFAFWK